MKSSQFLKLFTILIVLVSLGGCGYKPSAKYARTVLGNKISTSVYISATDPENSVIVKDAVDKAVIEVFHAGISERKYADTHLSITLSTPSYTPLQYDSNGFVVSYRATITLNIARISKNIQKKYVSKGTYDFAIESNAVLTDQQRFDAIKFSAIKAISAFVAQVSAEGASR